MSRPFSQRIGAVQVPEVLQIGSMDNALRVSLWNVLIQATEPYSLIIRTARDTAAAVLKIPVDDVPWTEWEARSWLRERFFEAPWYTVYEIIENFVRQPPA